MKRLLAALVLACALTLAACGGSTHAVKVAPAPACPGGYVTQYGCSAHSPTFGLPPKGLTLVPRSTVPTVAMYDSVTLSVLPHGAPAYAGYVNGNFANFSGLPAGSVHVPVTVQAFVVYPSTAKMACLDVEPGDAVPSSAGPWARGEIGLHVKPCIYANLSTMPQVRASLDAAHLARSSYFLWVADWTYSYHLTAGYDATQWTDHWEGRNVDGSAVTKAFLGIKPAPVLPLCFTHRMARSACSAAKKRIASDQRAAASSQRAYVARGCSVLSQRVSWFGNQLKHHPKVKTASRKRALAASRKAYAKQGCATFKSRGVYFTSAAAKLKAAN